LIVQLGNPQPLRNGRTHPVVDDSSRPIHQPPPNFGCGRAVPLRCAPSRSVFSSCRS
jgi:hypothetical protein